MPDKFIINKSYNKSRFDKWFKEEVIDLPNSLIQKLLRKNKIKVNNKRIKSSFRLTEGDVILVFNLSDAINDVDTSEKNNPKINNEQNIIKRDFSKFRHHKK